MNRTRSAALVSLFGAIALLRAEGPAPLVVTVRANANVAGKSVTIGDVAELSGGNANLRHSVEMLDLTDAPGARGFAKVTRQQVAFRIRLAGIPENLCQVRGTEESRIEAVHCVVAEADVIAAAEAVLRKRLPWNQGDIEVRQLQPIGVSLAVAAPREDVYIKAEQHAAGLPLGRTQVDISFFVHGQKRLAFPVYVEIRLIQSVAVCLKPIERGEPLTLQNVFFDRRSVEQIRNQVSSPETLTGKKARMALAPGHVITTNEIDDNPTTAGPTLMHRGDAVKLMVKLGPVNVLANGEVLQDGRVGQVVTVRNLESKKIITGRVADRSLVEVDP